MNTLHEQTAGLDQFPPRRQQPYRSDEGLIEEDDALYEQRGHSTARRYQAPSPAVHTRTVMRVTHHQAPPRVQRASRQAQEPPCQQSTRPSVHKQASCLPMPQQAPERVHWLAYVGVGMVLALVVCVAGSSLYQWWQGQRDEMHYGYPRTFQLDANVRHGGVSHFMVVNLHGHILITEMQLNDLHTTKVYVGPVFSGVGADLQPATVSFQDVNGDGYPDMVIAVGTGRYIMLNDHSAFRPSTPADKIMLSEVQP